MIAEEERKSVLSKMKKSELDETPGIDCAAADTSVISSLDNVQIQDRSSVSSERLSSKLQKKSMVTVNESDSSDDECGPPVPDHMKSKDLKQNNVDSDEEDIGPPLPPSFNQSKRDVDNQKTDSKGNSDSEDDLDDDGDGDDDVSLRR
jgi:hypothetical protein